MKLEPLDALVRQGRLYPAIILHGDSDLRRREVAVRLARILLCETEPDERPCGACRHCRRIIGPENAGDTFHPDFQVLERDLRASTSVAATKAFLKGAQVSPFEARGQVFVIASAESLTGGAANALLKTLEEPHTTSPRNFLLLAPSQFDLLPTLRSRSMAVYLGDSGRPDEERVGEVAEAFARCLDAFEASGNAAHLLAAATALGGSGSWDDPRAAQSWEVAAAAVTCCARSGHRAASSRRKLLGLAEALLGGGRMRLRSVPATRILEGLVLGNLESGTAA